MPPTPCNPCNEEIEKESAKATAADDPSKTASLRGRATFVALGDEERRTWKR
jgi:hypothetical protein